uniref:Uncharacterized protein n=1 Tax=Romanomermis culicivorax TaxID=13658 RepID=A0A915IT16_ROMCU
MNKSLELITDDDKIKFAVFDVDAVDVEIAAFWYCCDTVAVAVVDVEDDDEKFVGETARLTPPPAMTAAAIFAAGATTSKITGAEATCGEAATTALNWTGGATLLTRALDVPTATTRLPLLTELPLFSITYSKTWDFGNLV